MIPDLSPTPFNLFGSPSCRSTSFPPTSVRDSAGQLLAKQAVAQSSEPGVAPTVFSTWAYLDADGTPRVLGGESYTYDPFGRPTPRVPTATGGYLPPPQRIGWQSNLSFAGLNWVDGRWYDPATGRYLADDGRGGVGNFYVHAGNSPLGRDPGNVFTREWDGVKYIASDFAMRSWAMAKAPFAGGVKAYHLLEGEEWWFRLWSAAVITVLDNTGLLNIHDAFRGSQTLTARKLSMSERWLTGIEGVFNLGTIVATTGYGAVGRVRAIGGWAKRSLGLADDVGRGAGRGASGGSIFGTAQSPSRKFARNVGGFVRPLDDAVTLARNSGVRIGDDVRFRVLDDDLFDEMYGNNVFAAYGRRVRGDYYTKVGWKDLVEEDGMILVTLRRSVLESDQAIVGVLAHEMHEVNALRGMFGNGSAMQFSTLVNHIRVGRPGNLHDQAWDAANQLLDKIYGAP